MTPLRERREEQRDRLIRAAEAAIAQRGLSSLKARDLARETGVALGAIYNLVADLDEVILRVGGVTLDRLDHALSAATEGASSLSPEQHLVAIATAYRRFAAENLHLWRALFEHRLAADKPLPEWAVGNQTRLFRHIHAPLSVLMPEAEEGGRAAFSLTLFGAVHGVVAFGLEGRVVGVPAEDIDGELARLVRLVCAGLGRGRQSMNDQP